MTLTLTGERTLPGIATENYWFRRHEAAYAAALPWIRGADVLDAGSGEGYGAALLATVARRVVALDLDPAVTTHAATTYPRVGVARANLVALPLRDGALGAVVSLQVVEHLWDPAAFVAECARVLRPAGVLVLATPNRLTFSPGGVTNPFHSTEFSAAELVALLAPHFRTTRLYGVHHGRPLRRLDRRHAGAGGLVAAQRRTAPAVWHPDLRRDVAAVRARDFTVSRRHLDGSLDLLVVATRR